MIAGGVEPDLAADVILGDQVITGLPMYRRARLGVVYLPQEASIFRRLTVADNVARDPRDGRARIERGAASASMPCCPSSGSPIRPVREGLSLGGERRARRRSRGRWCSIRSSCCSDEPFAGIDPIAVIDIQKIIEQLKGAGIGIVITDHNVRETLAICDRAYIIKDGRIIREGTPSEIAADPPGARDLSRRELPLI